MVAIQNTTPYKIDNAISVNYDADMKRNRYLTKYNSGLKGSLSNLISH